MVYMYYYFIYIFTILTFETESNGFFDEDFETDIETAINGDENIDSYENAYLDYDKCNCVSFRPKLIINKYKTKNFLDSKPNPFSSACVKCLLCSTIAQHLHETLLSLHSLYIQADFISPEELGCIINNFCKNSFKGFDLRENNDDKIRCLTKSSKHTKHVPSSADGLWSVKLTEMCSEYFNATKDGNLYMRWFEESYKPDFDMGNILCRSYGIFQHCRGLFEQCSVQNCFVLPGQCPDQNCISSPSQCPANCPSENSFTLTGIYRSIFEP